MTNDVGVHLPKDLATIDEAVGCWTSGAGRSPIKEEMLNFRNKTSGLFRREAFQLGTIHCGTKFFKTGCAELVDEPFKKDKSVG